MAFLFLFISDALFFTRLLLLHTQLFSLLSLLSTLLFPLNANALGFFLGSDPQRLETILFGFGLLSLSRFVGETCLLSQLLLFLPLLFLLVSEFIGLALFVFDALLLLTLLLGQQLGSFVHSGTALGFAGSARHSSLFAVLFVGARVRGASRARIVAIFLFTMLLFLLLFNDFGFDNGCRDDGNLFLDNGRGWRNWLLLDNDGGVGLCGNGLLLLLLILDLGLAHVVLQLLD